MYDWSCTELKYLKLHTGPAVLCRSNPPSLLPPLLNPPPTPQLPRPCGIKQVGYASRSTHDRDQGVYFYSSCIVDHPLTADVACSRVLSPLHLAREADTAGHHEHDRNAVGARADFLVALTKAMVDDKCKTSNGNEISIPVKHDKDNPPAPDNLPDLLVKLNLVTPTLVLQAAGGTDSSEEYNLGPLQRTLLTWPKDLVWEHNAFTHPCFGDHFVLPFLSLTANHQN